MAVARNRVRVAIFSSVFSPPGTEHKLLSSDVKPVVCYEWNSSYITEFPAL